MQLKRCSVWNLLNLGLAEMMQCKTCSKYEVRLSITLTGLRIYVTQSFRWLRL